MTRLFRISGCAALLGGALRLPSQFIRYVPDDARLEALYGAIDVGFLLAMVGLVALCAPRIGTAGLALLLAALVGVASIVGPDRSAFGIDFYLAGSALFAFSLGLAAPWLWHLRALRPAAAAWSLGAMAGLASGLGGGPVALVIAGLALASGFIAVAPVLWRSQTWSSPLQNKP